AVLLELLEQALRSWLAEVTDELAAGVEPDRPARERGDRFAAIVARSLARHTVLCDLISTQAGVLEHNVSVEVVVRHKRAALDSLDRMVGLVQRHVPELGDDARALCLGITIMAGALASYCPPSASVLAAYNADPTLDQFPTDLGAALDLAVPMLVRGTLART
ncbi:MAG: TetR/AcrR family transcriptional regulator, partial [Actinomycetota bacterium]|nr:TetR/AcrR family transcriptional regulator [Actinomycetota bacterium]